MTGMKFPKNRKGLHFSVSGQAGKCADFAIAERRAGLLCGNIICLMNSSIAPAILLTVEGRGKFVDMAHDSSHNPPAADCRSARPALLQRPSTNLSELFGYQQNLF
jgi:hypothetical protein